MGNELNTLSFFLKKKQNNSIDKLFSFAICFQVTILGIKNALVQAVPNLYEINSQLNLLLFALIGLVYIKALYKGRYRFLRIRKQSLFVLIFVFLSLLTSAFFFDGNGEVIIEWLPRMITCCFITFLFISELRSFEWVEHYMTRFCYVTILFTTISSYYIYRNGHITTSSWSTYSMPLSYVTLLAVMWLLYKFFQRENLRDMFFLMIGLATIIIYGARNPLLAIASYVIIQTLRQVKKRNLLGIKRMLYIFISLFLFVMLFIWKFILTLMAEILNDFSIHSRTLNLLTQETISTSGRDVIHERLFDLLNNSPFVGLGVGGDAATINEIAHGLYLSILTSYGYILGIVIILVILFVCVKAYFNSVGLNREIVLLYTCIVLPRGFTGGDVWGSDVFWWMLGVCLAALNMKVPNLLENKVDV